MVLGLRVKSVLNGVMGLGLVIGLSDAVFAQDGNAVMDRYEGTGIRYGSFWFLPTLESGGFYDSNVFAEPNDPIDFFGVYVAPKLNIKSDIGRHGFEADLGGAYYDYLDVEELNRGNVYGKLRGFVEVQRDLVIEGRVRGSYDELAPGDIDALIGARTPTPQTLFEADAAINKAFNRLTLSVGAGYSLQRYGDVELFNEDIDFDEAGRNGEGWIAGGRAAYEISPGYRVFGDFRYNELTFDDVPGFDTDLSGIQALGWGCF